MTHKVLYLPIHIPGTYHERSIANKRGLREAFAQVGQVYELDYIAVESDYLFGQVRNLIETFQPSLLFTQIQGLNHFTAEQLRFIRQNYNLPIVNWNGDYWPEVLLSGGMCELLREVNVQLVINASVLDAYKDEGVRAAFWPFGVERPDYPWPVAPAYDIVFLGNNYSEKRQQLYEVLRSLPYKVGVYGAGWAQSEGECNYDFATAAALYGKARIAISDNQFPEALGYLSDRPYQAMAARCLVLQQRVAELEQWTGFVEGQHYLGFDTLSDLPAAVEQALNNPDRINIARRAQDFVFKQHSFDVRVKELFTMLEGVQA